MWVRHLWSKLVILVGSLLRYHNHEADRCSTVYDISILSGIPSSVCDLLPLDPLPTRLLPLFAVGVHDMPTLALGSRTQTPSSSRENDSMGYGWVANTTDDILAMKPHLYDTVVTLPPSYTQNAKEKHWPRLEIRKGSEVRATQRDLRRYRILRHELRRSNSPNSSRSPALSSSLPLDDEQGTDDDAESAFDAELVEPQSWSALAYNSFMWWASAGEKRTDINEEEEYDAALLQNFDIHYSDGSPTQRPGSSGRSPNMRFDTERSLGLEMRIIAYFHRLTTLILKTLSDIIDATDSVNDYPPYSSPAEISQNSNNNDNGGNDTQPLLPTKPEDEPSVSINHEDMTRMGLDIWSEGDRTFVRELVGLYWGRRADVRGGKVECCGVRIC